MYLNYITNSHILFAILDLEDRLNMKLEEVKTDSLTEMRALARTRTTDGKLVTDRALALRVVWHLP